MDYFYKRMDEFLSIVKDIDKNDLLELIYVLKAWEELSHDNKINDEYLKFGTFSNNKKKTVKEFKLPYNEFKTTKDAIIAHFNYLRLMGIKPTI